MSFRFVVDAQETPEVAESVHAEEQVDALPWLGLLLCACFLLAGKHVAIQRWRNNSVPANAAQQLRETRQHILQTLVELDTQYESGRVGKDVYRRERTRRKQQLVELTVLYESSVKAIARK